MKDATSRKRISVALSGGGHRASLFVLGVLLYLTDNQKNQDVVALASVSGGSITNGYYAKAKGFHRLNPKDGLQHARVLAQQLALRGTLWACVTTKLYLAATSLALVLVVAVWATSWHWYRLLLFVVGLSVWERVFVAKRGHIADWAYAQTLFSQSGKRTPLSDIETGINHVFCATDLHAGEHVYFAGDFVYAYRFGFGKPADIPLSTVVQVSAAFPFGFPPRILKTKRHQFQGGQQSDAPTMVLSDGGDYDNMAEEWAIGLERRKARVQAPQFKDADELIVVNASAAMGWHSLWLVRLPLVGEIFSLYEVINTLYDNTTSPRRTSLISQFMASAKAGHGLTGGLVTIDQTPYGVAKFFKENGDPQQKTRAQNVLDALKDHSEADWAQRATANGKVATTLSKLGREVSARLMYQAYVVANANLHVILGYPLLPILTLDDFEKRIFD